MIQFSCRSCRTLHEAPENHAGVEMECYLCGGVVRVPGGERDVVDTKLNVGRTEVDKKPIFAGEKRVMPPPVPKVASARPRCPECKIPLKVAAGYGKNVQCPLCTSWFRVEASAQTRPAKA